MFGAGRYSIPRPVTRNLEDLDSVQSVLLHRSAAGRGREAVAGSGPLGAAPLGARERRAAWSPSSRPCGGAPRGSLLLPGQEMKRAEPVSALALSGRSGSRGPSAGRWGGAPGSAGALGESAACDAGAEIEATEAVGSVRGRWERSVKEKRKS